MAELRIGNMIYHDVEIQSWVLRQHECDDTNQRVPRQLPSGGCSFTVPLSEIEWLDELLNDIDHTGA